MAPDLEFSEVSISWLVEMYRPLPTEFDTVSEWRRALASPGASALRLTKLSRDAASLPGHHVPVASFRLPLDAVAPLGARCPVCSRPVKRAGVTTAGIALHAKCLPGPMGPGTVAELLPFAEELEERRPLKTVLPLLSLRPGGSTA